MSTKIWVYIGSDHRLSRMCLGPAHEIIIQSKQARQVSYVLHNCEQHMILNVKSIVSYIPKKLDVINGIQRKSISLLK